MSSMVEQLRKLGLVTDGQVQKRQASLDLEEEARRKRQHKNAQKSVSEEELHDCRNIKKFRHTAKEFLLQGGDIRVVIRAAHAFDDKRLTGQLYGLKRNLESEPESHHERLIKRALRGAGRRHNRDI